MPATTTDGDTATGSSTEIGSTLVCVEDYKVAASARLPRPVLGYYRAGATGETTLRGNREAFNGWYILPRILRDVSLRILSTDVLGMRLQMPVAIAPTAMQKMAHPDGECASARAAERLGSAFTLSLFATSSIQEVAKAAPGAIKFLQLYILKDRALAVQHVRKAEAAGFRAVVVTVDHCVSGIRWQNVREPHTLTPPLRFANLDAFYEEAERKGEVLGLQFAKDEIVPYNTWDDLRWIVGLTSLPVVAKGVLTREGARRAVMAGVAAILVSNHGGRLMDGVPQTIEALPHVVAEVAGRCPVFVDGGFTQGTEVFKALALGASLVFVGRPVLWGLACGGEEGVHDVLSIIRDELDNVMANTGCSSIQDINKNMVVRKETYCKL